MSREHLAKDFMDAKFGMFIHWGIYASRSRGEWSIYRDEIPRSEYKKYLRMFNPKFFDAKEWVRMAKDAGMKYMCITSKHHDGFCLFDSDYTDFKITNTPFKRDIIGELSDACHELDMKFCVYYSIWDLWHPGLTGYDQEGKDPDKIYPCESGWKPTPEGIEYMHNQVEEICTKYGKIDYFFFDVRRAEGEDYDGWTLIGKMHKWQPDMMINNRLGVGGDVGTPENSIPENSENNEHSNMIMWEACACSNKNWAYVHDDKSFKSWQEITRDLVQIVGNGGNYLINIGPTALGEFPQENIEMLENIGKWMKYHSEAIYETTPVPLGKKASHFRWRSTYATKSKDGSMIYIHIPNWPAGGSVDNKITIPKSSIGKEIDFMYLLGDGAEVTWLDRGYYGKTENEYTLVLPRVPSNDAVSIVAIKLK